MDAVLQDLRYAWRHIRRSPGFALAAILTLALGIGANTAMFSMLNALTLARLPVPDPDGLMAILPVNARGLPRSTPVSAVDELRDGPLDPVCGYLGAVVLPVLANETPVQTLTTFITAKCLAVFGVAPILGRDVTEEEAPVHSAGAHVALISHRMWRGTFNSDPGILGRTMLVNNVSVSIIGVLPPRFVGLDVDAGVDVFTPFDAVLAAGNTRRQLASALLGRLRPGVSFEQAGAELRTRWPALIDAVVPGGLAPSEAAQLRDSSPRLEHVGTGQSRHRVTYAQPLTIILGLTALLLVLACINLGGLLSARLIARGNELTVRLALGGSRQRIAQQMLIENLLLSVSGSLLALPIAYAVVSLLASFIPPGNVATTMSFAPDGRVMLATGAVGLLVGVIMSAMPVVVAMRRRTVRFNWDRTVAGASGRWGRVLLTAQVALSVVMLVGAVLLTRSLYLLQHTDLGIRTDNILNIKLNILPNAPYSRSERASYYPPLLDKVAALPGIRAVALADNFPRVLNTVGMPVTFVGEEPRGLLASGDYVSPNFFDAMGIALIEGRTVAWSDTLQTRNVAVISESLAKALGGNVLERQIRIRTLPTDQEMVIVGVVADATQGNPRLVHSNVIYRPALQSLPISAFNPNLLIDTADAATAAAGVRQILRDGGRDYPQEIIWLNDLLARAPATERMSATVAGAIGLLGVVLALLGVHGALAYAVSRRRREIGVRVAVGATPSSVARGVVLDGLVIAATGVALGLPASYFGARLLKSLMFGVTEVGGVTFASVAIFFLALGMAAGWLPARRAARVDPVVALRAD